MPTLRLQEIAEYGADARCGNLLGIQPFMTPEDYVSGGRFHAKLDGYLSAASQRSWLSEKTIVVLPEHIGTWLVAVGEGRRVYQAKSVESAMRTLVLSNLVPFVETLPFAQTRDRVTYGVFRVKAARMAAIYHSTFARLAREHAVTIVGGSIVLPSPGAGDDVLVPGTGPLYNVCLVYRPNGSAYQEIVHKAFPTEAELPFTARAAVDALPIFDTPAGRLGVLICADSWYPCAYEVLKAKQADLAAVPAYLSPDGAWEKAWRGYSGAPAPEDVDADDANRITEGAAWLKYALAGRMAGAEIRHGINVFLRGTLWNLGSDGHTILVRERAVFEAGHVPGAAITNLWLL